MRTTSRLSVLLALASLLVLLGESAAYAQRSYYGRGYGPPRGYYAPGYGGGYGFHQHDGFYMRLHVGFGYMSASETYGGATDDYTGGGASYGAALGGAILPNLIVYGEVFGTTIVNAEYGIDGVTQGYSGTDLSLLGFGPGIAYYFIPVNLYLSGTLTLSQVSFSDTDTADSLGDTNLGLGVSFMVGKEWWVSSDWGIGVAGRFHFASMGDTVGVYDTRLRTSVLSLLFSASYN
jgi:hypothetical protein